MSERRGRFELVGALLAALVAVTALLVSAYAAYWQRQAARAQMWPHLDWGYSNLNGFSYNLENGGVGPAQITSVKVTVDHKPVSSWEQAITALIGSYKTALVNTTLHHRLVRAGATFDVLHIADAAVAERVMAQHQRLRVEICYCSVLGECWTFDGDGRDAAVASCASEGGFSE